MADLVTLAELYARLGRDDVSDVELARFETLIADASATVRAYTGQYLEAVADDVLTIKARCGKVRLPQRPVTDVSSVVWSGTPIDFAWTAGDMVTWWSTPGLNRFDLDASVDGEQWVTVTYSHGFAEIPPDVVAVVWSVVLRASGRPADQTGITQESLGAYAYSVGGAAGAGPLGLLADERRILDLYRRPVGVAWTI